MTPVRCPAGQITEQAKAALGRDVQLHRFIITLRGRTGYLRPELEEEPIRGENGRLPGEGGSKAAEGNADGMPGAVGQPGPVQAAQHSVMLHLCLVLWEEQVLQSRISIKQW